MSKADHTARWLLGAALFAGCAPDSGGDAADQTAPLYVGVVPAIATDGTGFCPIGSNRQSVTFRLDNDGATHCGSSTGARGEGRWVAPQAVKYPIQEPPCAGTGEFTMLYFCRVEVGAAEFRPLTTDPADAANFYALLKFGNDCPAGSVTVVKKIVNESEFNTNELQAPPNAAYPNTINGDILGNLTHLHFCFFRAAERKEATMRSFPDLGIPYAVFHDFDGEQPDWVIEKRWEFTDDDNDDHQVNGYSLAPADIIQEFMHLVENPKVGATVADTYFDQARVR